MINFIENILCHFESCFSRRAAFRWFVAIITGLMLRSDKLGVTSIIRDLALAPGCYEPMLHFFRASSWSLEGIRERWHSAVSRYAPLYKEGNLHVLVGDGVKQSKEGRRMPGVKKLFQESGNSAKPGFIHGHMFGGLGILAGSIRNWACIPLSIRLHDGLQAAGEWEGASVSAASHVVQMVEDAYKAALAFGDSLLLLDRYLGENNEKNLHHDNVLLMRKALKLFPNNALLLVQLSTSLEKLEGTEEERARNLRESIALQKQILRYGEDSEVRGSTLYNICFAYWKNGERDKALEYAKKLPNLYKARENALVHFLEGEEKHNVAKGALVPLALSITQHLSVLAQMEENPTYYEKAERILDLLFEGEEDDTVEPIRKALKEGGKARE